MARCMVDLRVMNTGCTKHIHAWILATDSQVVHADSVFLERVERLAGLMALAHKQERALVTRERLINAAREIFTRDGFESARIEDIAARARKTRGAFYDNFRDKEDIFFAIYEED